MPIILGVLFHFLGGFASGSFYIPYKKIDGWGWESFWIVGGIFSWLIVPPLAAWLTIPGFVSIILRTPMSVILYTSFFGALWGVGGLTYGLGVRYLGVSLGSTIILGLCAVFGSLLPSVYYNFFPNPAKDNFNTLITTYWGQLVLAGIVICILGIIICGKAGVMKEKDTAKSDRVTDDNKEYKFSLGIAVAIVSGILSACFNFGIETGKPMAAMVNKLWQANHAEQGNFLFQNNITYIILLWGGFTTNFIWCLILNFRHKTFGDYANKDTPLLKNYLLCAMAGTMWFLQFFFYGMGESKLGNGASSWILHMAFIILVANGWGLVLKEWTLVTRKTITVLITGILTIIFSVIIVGYGNSMK